MISIIIGIIIGFVFGCWLSLSNIEDKYYENYLEMCKWNRKMIFILACSKSKTFIDIIINMVVNDINKVKELWQKNISEREHE